MYEVVDDADVDVLGFPVSGTNDIDEFRTQHDYIKQMMETVGPQYVQLMEFAQTLPQAFPHDDRVMFWVEHLQQQYCIADSITQKSNRR